MAEAAAMPAAPVTLAALRPYAVVAALVLYALWGVPAPGGVGAAEMAIAVLLLTAAGWNLFTVLQLRGQPLWRQAGAVLLAYGLSVPALTGIMTAAAHADIFRDIIGFIFLLLPLFLAPLFAGREYATRQLTAATAFIGVVFALRVSWPLLAGHGAAVADPFRLANAPTVLFAALLLAGLAGLYLYRGDLLRSMVLFLLCLAPLAAMALITQRASIGVFAASAAILLTTGLVRRPLRVLLPLALAVLTATAYWPAISGVLDELWRKQATVGLNMRWQEAMAVSDVMDDSLFAVLFGRGWGASFASPAVGGDVVTFTHSLLTTYWLKTGLAGLALVLLYLWQVGRMILSVVFRNPVIGLALAGPFAIDVLLYASFKSLDFGLLLLLVPLWAGLLQNPPAYSR